MRAEVQADVSDARDQRAGRALGERGEGGIARGAVAETRAYLDELVREQRELELGDDRLGEALVAERDERVQAVA